MLDVEKPQTTETLRILYIGRYFTEKAVWGEVISLRAPEVNRLAGNPAVN